MASIINPYYKKLIPVEVTLLLYIIITTIIILFFWNRLEEPINHLIPRLLLILTYFLVLQKRGDNFLKGLRIFIPFALLLFFYGETDFFNNIIFSDLDPFFSDFEQNIFGVQPSIVFSEILPDNFFAEVMYFGYFSYYIMIVGLVFYTYFLVGKEIGEKVGFMIITSFLIFYIVFDFIPVAGPQFFFIDQLKPIPEGFIFGPIIKLVQQIGERPTAAFPSSHVALCLILIWLAYKNSRKLFLLLFFIGVILIFSTVYIRAHYVVDVIAGIFIAPFIYILVEQMFKKLSLPVPEKS